MLQEKSRSYELFFRLMIEVFADSNDAKRCGEKTPQNIRYLRELVTIFPRAKIVHIVRDPRDVVASLMRMPWAPDSIVMNALKWKIDMLYVREFSRSGGVVHEFRYEDLIDCPDDTLRLLCRFLGLTWDPAMLDFNVSADSNIRDEPWKNGTRRELNATAVAGWKKTFKPAEAGLIQTICSPFLKNYRYFPEPLSLNARFAMPVVIAADVTRYLARRTTLKLDGSSKNPREIVGEESRIRAKMVEAVLTRKI
jgi:hypothetical protein